MTHSTIAYDGDTWRILNTGEERDGKTLTHLVSTTRFTTYRNQTVPLELMEYIETEKVSPKRARLRELFPVAAKGGIKSVRVITSCTSRKTITEGQCMARDLYAGEQHRRLLQGMDQAGPINTELQILSAGYGLIPGDRKVAPYNRTFAGMSIAQMMDVRDQLGIAEAARNALDNSADLTLVLLGDTYLTACCFPPYLETTGPVVFVHGKYSKDRLPKGPNIYSAEIGETDTRIFGAGLVGLKGEVARQLLEQLGQQTKQEAA